MKNIIKTLMLYTILSCFSSALFATEGQMPVAQESASVSIISPQITTALNEVLLELGCKHFENEAAVATALADALRAKGFDDQALFAFFNSQDSETIIKHITVTLKNLRAMQEMGCPQAKCVMYVAKQITDLIRELSQPQTGLTQKQIIWIIVGVVAVILVVVGVVIAIGVLVFVCVLISKRGGKIIDIKINKTSEENTTQKKEQKGKEIKKQKKDENINLNNVTTPNVENKKQNQQNQNGIKKEETENLLEVVIEKREKENQEKKLSAGELQQIEEIKKKIEENEKKIEEKKKKVQELDNEIIVPNEKAKKFIDLEEETVKKDLEEKKKKWIKDEKIKRELLIQVEKQNQQGIETTCSLLIKNNDLQLQTKETQKKLQEIEQQLKKIEEEDKKFNELKQKLLKQK